MPGQIFLPFIVPPIQLGAFSHHREYADDFTLLAVVSSPGVRVTVAESLSCKLVKVSK